MVKINLNKHQPFSFKSLKGTRMSSIEGPVVTNTTMSLVGNLSGPSEAKMLLWTYEIALPRYDALSKIYYSCGFKKKVFSI